MDDKQLVSITAVLVLLLTSAVLRRRGEDRALMCALRSRPPGDDYAERIAEEAFTRLSTTWHHGASMRGN